MNPYEPPQAIDQPPPVAELAPTPWPIVVETPQRPRAAAHCAWAGQMLLLATLIAALQVLGEVYVSFFAGLLSPDLAKNLNLLSGLSIALLLGGGGCKNLIGFALFAQLAHDHATAASYRVLLLLGLAKGGVFGALCWAIFTPGASAFLKLGFLIALGFLVFHGILLQTQVLRRWQVLLARPFARGLLEGYKYLSLTAILVYGTYVWNLFQAPREPLPWLVLGALLLLAGSMVAYSKLYRQLETELQRAG